MCHFFTSYFFAVKRIRNCFASFSLRFTVTKQNKKTFRFRCFASRFTSDFFASFPFNFSASKIKIFLNLFCIKFSLATTIATNSSFISYIATTSSSIPSIASTSSSGPYIYIVPYKYNLILYSFRCNCRVYFLILYSLCCYSITSSIPGTYISITYVVTTSSCIALWCYRYNLILNSLCCYNLMLYISYVAITSSSIPYVAIITLSSIPYVAITSSSIPCIATVQLYYLFLILLQPCPIFLMLLQPHSLFLMFLQPHSIFLMLNQLHSLFLMLLQPHPLLIIKIKPNYLPVLLYVATTSSTPNSPLKPYNYGCFPAI